MTEDYIFGEYIDFSENTTVEQAREVVVQRVCDELNRIAKEEPQLLFIEKERTVGCKLIIPEHN